MVSRRVYFLAVAQVIQDGQVYQVTAGYPCRQYLKDQGCQKSLAV